MRERVEAMKTIWASDEAEYHGEHVDFDPIWSWPKPVQEPHPPILVGGNGEKAIDRVVAFGDEWMPNVGRSGLDELGRRIAELQEKASDAGREAIPVSGFGAPRDPETVERLEEIGFSRLYWYVPPESRDEVAKRLERYATRVRELA
jgi:alkanesulfonate monooxygenase SsuD/methylene tetrahydromethanopterin reductase-like flavin-dependent oxidoreductase (luciferase family)